MSYRQLLCPLTQVIQMISVEVTTGYGTFVITAVYHPGSASHDQIRLLKRNIDILSSLNSNHIITVDLIARH